MHHAIEKRSGNGRKHSFVAERCANATLLAAPCATVVLSWHAFFRRQQSGNLDCMATHASAGDFPFGRRICVALVQHRRMREEGEAVPRPYGQRSVIVGATHCVALCNTVACGDRARQCLAPTNAVACGDRARQPRPYEASAGTTGSRTTAPGFSGSNAQRVGLLTMY